MGGTGDVDLLQVKGWRDWECGLITSERREGLGMWTLLQVKGGRDWGCGLYYK